MSIFLAIESSTDLASAALFFDGDHGSDHRSDQPRLYQEQVSGVHAHSHTILPMIQALLARAGIGLADCTAIAFGAGPGSFTGVRTACGIAQGLAYGADLPIVPVDTLMATAQACRSAGDNQAGCDDVLVVIDARMAQVYWGQYHWHGDAAGDGWQAVTAARLDAPLAVVAQGVVTACGNGLTAYATAFAGRAFMRDARPAMMPHAAAIAQLAALQFERDGGVAARDAQPIYLRNDVALTTLERALKHAQAAS